MASQKGHSNDCVLSLFLLFLFPPFVSSLLLFVGLSFLLIWKMDDDDGFFFFFFFFPLFF